MSNKTHRHLTLPIDLLVWTDELTRAYLYCMTRSLKKGPYVDERLLAKIAGKKPIETGMIKTWSRACVISPEMVGFVFGVHNGKVHVEVLVSEDMVGHRLGEFSPTRKFTKHGGKMQKELEEKKKEAEIAASKTAKSTTESKK